MDILYLLFNLLCRGINILDITQITLHKSHSAIVLSKFNSLSNSPFIIGSLELVLAPGDNNDLFDAVEKKLGCYFYIGRKESMRFLGLFILIEKPGDGLGLPFPMPAWPPWETG